MKRKIVYIICSILLILFIIYNIGLQIGNIHIGKQTDDIGGFNSAIVNSKFSKDYLKTDSLVVLNLWATWCKPCIEEMPEFTKLAEKHKNVKFAFLSIDKDKDKLQMFLEQNKINDIILENAEFRRAIQNFLEGRPLSSLVSNEIVPITHILKNGKVIHKETGGIDDVEFEKVLNSKIH